MSMGTQTMPKLRFPGFTGDWEQRKLGSISNIIDPHPSHRAPTEVSVGIPFIGIGDVDAMGNIDANSARTVAEEIYDEHHRRYDLNVPSLGIGRVASLGKVIRLRNDIGKYAVSPTMSIVQIRDEVNIDYLYSCMESPIFQKQFAAQSNGSTRQSVGIQDLRELIVSVPRNDEEQKTIGAFFKNLDNTITLHQRKCDEIIELKKGMLQKMFPKEGESEPEIRFLGFAGDWEQRKLGKLTEIKDSARIPNAEWSESGVPYIRASDISNEDINGILFISPERYEYYRARTGAPSQGDVLFNGGGEIGKALLNADDKPIYVQGGAVLYARTSVSESLDGQFLKTYFETPSAKNYIDVASAGGTMKHFTLKPALEMPLCIPDIPEQIIIGNFFRSLDNLITLHQRKCDEFKTLKKAFLQQMFV